MSSSTLTFRSVACAAGRIRIVCEAHEVVNVWRWTLVDSRVPVLSTPSTLSEAGTVDLTFTLTVGIDVHGS